MARPSPGGTPRPASSSRSPRARDLPLDILKLDRAFVANVCEDRRVAAIVAAITDLANALDLPVVAEGVETDDQRRRLHGLGCHLGQGFLFSRSRPPERLEAWLEAPVARPLATAAPHGRGRAG